MVESFKDLMRKKILDLKTDNKSFYTETFNLVTVILRLNTDEKLEPVRRKMIMIYRKPSEDYGFSLPHLEKLYFKFLADPNMKTKGVVITEQDIKKILDKARRDLLFYLALIEDRPKDYGIVLEQEKDSDL